VLDALKKREAEVKKAMKAEDAAAKREADADALEAAIKQTDDPEIKATLRAEADKLREKIPTPEVTEGLPADKSERVSKIPVGKTKEVAAPEPITPAPRAKLAEPEVAEIAPEVVEGGEPIPKGEATEVEPVPVGQADEVLPVGEATEVVPVGEVSEILPAGETLDGPPSMDRVPMPPAPKPRIIDLPPAKIRKIAKDHGLGAKDMERAKAVAAALAKDEEAVVAATTKGHTPAAFDAEIERINREPKVSDASQSPQAAESSPRPEPRGQDAATRAEQPRPDGAATARADKPKVAPAKADRKPLIARKNSEILADLNKQIDAEARYGAGGPERITLKSGGTTQTISNSPDGVAKWRAEAAKSYGFKDTNTPKPAASRTFHGPSRFGGPNPKPPVDALNKRAPKTVVADMVAEGDFENAEILAEHYGIDVKAGMDPKQRKAYQDYTDSKDLTGLADTPPVVEPPAASSAALKKWFGASKLTNEKGEPKVLYHATPHDFDQFKVGGANPGMSGHAVWLSPSKDRQPAAHNVNVRGGGFREGTRVMPLYARVERPLVIDTPAMLAWAKEVFAEGSENFPQVMPKQWVDRITKGGEYDGVVFKGEALGWGKDSDEVVVFDPKQLKSALGNSGTFDPNSPSLTDR
jgi:hypothetical protein